MMEYTDDNVSIDFDWKLWKQLLIQSSLQGTNIFRWGYFCINCCKRNNLIKQISMYDFAKREIYMLLIIGLTTDMIRRFDDFLIMTMYPTYNCGCFQYDHNACFSLTCANGILQI